MIRPESTNILNKHYVLSSSPQIRLLPISITDRWVSTLHRVVMPSTDALERRYSMAYFVNINGDAMVEALTDDDTEMKKYVPISARDHLMAKHLASMGGTVAEEVTADHHHDDDGTQHANTATGDTLQQQQDEL